MSVARTANRRFLVLLTVVVLAIVILSLISFEVVIHFTTLLQAFHGVAYTKNGIMPWHP
ncbi:MAG TPA: hypothetical protein VNE61_16410 [Ktedonobacteraceae bacterium]|nr:hypothetical protein [Ktedonobacteraceae bacterium]